MALFTIKNSHIQTKVHALNKGAIVTAELLVFRLSAPKKDKPYSKPENSVAGHYSGCSVLVFLNLFSPLNFSFAVKIFSVANNRDAMYIITMVKAAT